MFPKKEVLKIPAILGPKTEYLPISHYHALPNIDPTDYLVIIH